uniref:Ig-like domain-containing protein n=1 Tax=Cyprinus carpio TaxID=7962 RepID=A0A8C2EW47_CYPCA
GSCHASGLWRRFGPAHFECRLTPIGDPTMIVEWLHDSKPLEAANRLRMINEFGYCSLDYEAAYSRDSGVITCRATNKFGVDQTSSTLIVKDEKSLVEETQLPEGRRGQRIDEIERIVQVSQLSAAEKWVEQMFKLPGQPPCFTTQIQPVRCAEGSEVKFQYRVTGTPFPDVQWFKSKSQIKSSQTCSVVSNPDGTGFLIMNNIQQSDSGLYTCKAVNPFGEASCSAELIVSHKKVSVFHKQQLVQEQKSYKVSMKEEFAGRPSGNLHHWHRR